MLHKHLRLVQFSVEDVKSRENVSFIQEITMTGGHLFIWLYVRVFWLVVLVRSQTYPSQEIPNIQSSCHSSLNWTEFTLAHRALTCALPSPLHQPWSAALCVCVCLCVCWDILAPLYLPITHSNTQKNCSGLRIAVCHFCYNCCSERAQTSRSNADLSAVVDLNLV